MYIGKYADNEKNANDAKYAIYAKMQHANQTSFTMFRFQMKCLSALTLNSQ